MEELKAWREAFSALPEGCTAAEVNLVIKQTVTVSCADGKITDCGSSDRNMLFVRATGKRTGIVYSENLSADPAELILLALENSQVVEADAPQPMQENRQDTHINIDTPVETAALVQKAKELSKLPGVVECTITSCIRRSVVLNSLGTETEQCQPNYKVALTVPGKGEDNYKVAEWTRKSLDEIDISAMLERIAAENTLSHDELPFITLPAGSYDAVLSSAMMVNVMNTAWQLFAQRLIDSSRSPIRMGDQLGTALLNIVDSPVCPWSGYDFTIDGEGIRGPEQNHLVTNGVVTNTLRTAKHGDSTGCAGRADLLTANINIELIPVPRNVWIEPGEFTPEQLVEKLGTGIHLTYSMDEYHSLNIAGATFSIPCGGVYYENGKPVGRLRQMNICGSFRELFAGLEAVGNDIAMRGMWPHYDYAFGGPSLLIRGANFAM